MANEDVSPADGSGEARVGDYIVGPDERTGERLRSRDSLEFARLMTLTDGIFAIAMTLLVLPIAVPTIARTQSVEALWKGLDENLPNLISFFISFIIIGRYWVANHRFVQLLARISSRFVTWSLVYLAFVALMPFPTALFGTYDSNPLALAIYATSIALVSGLEVVLMFVARKDGLLALEMPPDVFRWGTIDSLVPVVVMTVSIPIAFVDTWVAVGTWILVFPIEMFLDRHKPDHFDDYF